MKKRKKEKKYVSVDSDLCDFLRHNRQEGAWPVRLTDWIDEQLREQRDWISNRQMNEKITKLDNRTINLQNHIDLLEHRIIALERKMGIFKS